MNNKNYVKSVLQDRVDYLQELMKHDEAKGIWSDHYIRLEKIEILKKQMEEIK